MLATKKSGGAPENTVPATAKDLTASLEDLRRKVIADVGYLDRDVEQRMHEQATLTSAQYALEHMTTALPVHQTKYPGNGHLELIEQLLLRAPDEGFFAEFGVFRGHSLAFIAERIDKIVYGFDSFEGLPGDWSARRLKGTLSLDGVIPEFPATLRNFRIVKGAFLDSIPNFLSQISGSAAFLHFDCYLYESTRDALDRIGERIESGTTLVFRQYFNYPGWQRHQFQAFQEFIDRSGRTYKYISFSAKGYSVAIVID
jgi:hypothetical protein